MRKLLAAFGVGLLLSASGALSVDEQIAEWRGIFSRAKIRPLRTVNGKVHNITPLADFMINLEKPTAHHTRPPGFDDWAWIVGEVIQVADDGLLIRNYGDVSLDGRYETVFLVNAPSQNTRVDGSKIGALAMLVGRQQYVTTTGAKATVQKYDCGTTPAREIIVAHEQNQRAKIEESLALRNSILARQESERTARQITATTKAVEYQQRRANEGYASAQYDLGMRYLKGDGVEKDEGRARLWLAKAAAQGNGQAKKAMERMALELSTK